MSLSIGNLLRVKEIRNKLLITLGLLACYRIGFFVPLPGVNLSKFLELQASRGPSEGIGRVLDYMNILTGASLQQASLFSLGVMPYISASIIFSLMVKVVPALEKLSKEGPSGQRKINRYTRYATIPICIVQSIFVISGVLFGSASGAGTLHAEVMNWSFLYSLLVILCLTTGTLFIMWLGEQITEHGAGNGISLIIMAGIVAELPSAFGTLIGGGNAATDVWQTVLVFLAAWFFAVVAVVFITKAQRRIPIQQAKHNRGRRVYGGERHFLPLKVNHAGVMPIIFASALLIVPAILAGYVKWSVLDGFQQNTGFWYVLLYGVLIFFFSFFWTSLMFQPNEMADNLKDHGSFIPGIRPGKPTAEFLEQTMVRLTLAGAAFLTVIAVLPTFARGGIQGLNTTLIYFMSGTSILIVVGVALDLVEKLNAMLIMRNYDGIIDESGAASRGWGRQR